MHFNASNLHHKVNHLIYLVLSFCLTGYSIPSYSDNKVCQPYLIDINSLTTILANNIKNSPLTNPVVSINEKSKCPIEMRVSLAHTGLKIAGCTSPIHNDDSVGLAEIKVSEPIITTIPAGLTNVKDKIIKHCGSYFPIASTKAIRSGVMLIFK